MKNTARQAVANLAMAWVPKTDIKTIEVIYYGDCPTYIRVMNQVAGSHRREWGALHNGCADKVAQQMLETEEYAGYTLKKTIR